MPAGIVRLMSRSFRSRPSAAALARRAGRDGRPRLRAVTAAALARLEARDLDRALAAADRVDELDLQLHAQVGAAHRAALAAAGLASEERVEEVIDAEARSPVGAAEHVVALAALRVGEHLVRLGHLAEPRRGVVALVVVGVVLARELAVRAADLILGRLARDPQDGVVIGTGHQ